MEENETETEEETPEANFEDKTPQEAYDLAVFLVERGAGFGANLYKHNLSVAGSKVVDGGKFLGKPGLLDCDDPLARIEDLYARYKRSVPSERTERKKRNGTQFMALEFEDLDDSDFLYGDRRNEAQAKLEMFVLLAVSTGQLKWTDGMGKWFWKSPKDRDLVLLKDWVVIEKPCKKEE